MVIVFLVGVLVMSVMVLLLFVGDLVMLSVHDVRYRGVVDRVRRGILEVFYFVIYRW